MGQFWESATEQAGREFGARHYRWFVGARVFRKIAPAIFVLALVTAAVAGVVWAYQWADPDWAAIGDSATGWTADIDSVLLWVGGGALALLVLAGVVAAIRRNWWSWWNLSRPMWLRRY